MEAFTFIMVVIIYLKLGDIHKDIRKNNNAIHALNAERLKHYGR